ncbi:ATP-dependent DNA helicase uvrD [Candidatus Kinetoplastibacterium blastocrithidii TCC012E]|uniref:DNA 3'-5' helicase n=1 Tax=Candidatus Kinetoplastidibacterium blastocrithidiae TCC012E TaxID=1208922 RepID=M1M3D2_9PROT|nr:UvrD-helicase domain-containing protein [Candidatus Kinetoplastibacterium blastocrithidii]AFZ83550.1 DNA helicase II [Candidatus Kinetoplastibacterium blastocrithidii (ex Strigomonas culicis)]AGF49669.1 ATP-dependent DNA helicase uvrD [Candidatus Kinetoplastibacterium blastocrithidii TCC012E]
MILEELNKAQKEAVTLGASHALVLAGAGSGKTKVLASRLSWLLDTNQTAISSILAVTFTNKAAREMISRVLKMVNIDIRGLWIGTFHGLCHRMLRIHSNEINLSKNFQIIDISDQISLIKQIIKGNNINDLKYQPKDFQRFINSQKENGVRFIDVDINRNHNRYLLDFYKLYEDYCFTHDLVDFSELLLRCYELLKNNDDIRRHYNDKFAHILIDEFQDTNKLQYKWINLIAGKQTSVFAVGDDDQSIYAFRGADIDNMSSFEKTYAKGSVIRLEQNYRSFGNILGAANSLIKYNKGRLGKTLWTEQGKGDPIRVVESSSDIAEAYWLVEEIRGLIRKGVSASDIAVLYRSNMQSRVIEHALFSSNIPYTVYGGLRFFERQEVKHALAYLRLILNPNDDNAWLRVVNFPPRGIGIRTIENHLEIAKSNNLSLMDSAKHVSGRGGVNISLFASLIDDLIINSNKLTLPELIEYTIDRSGLSLYYKSDKDLYDRLENLKELITAATVFSIEEKYDSTPACSFSVNAQVEEEIITTPLIAFLSNASLEASENISVNNNSSVQLMTVHASKGLEFRIVFITGAEEGLFPHENSISEDSGLEEERRLMYVAITRAEERLYISMANSRMLRGQVRYPSRSRFLNEIDANHIQWSKSGGVYDNYPSRSFKDGPNISYNKSSKNTLINIDCNVSSNKGLIVNDKLFLVGQSVNHGRFGEGVIVRLIGSGNSTQAQVNFQKHGMKTLALSVAKLDIKE